MSAAAARVPSWDNRYTLGANHSLLPFGWGAAQTRGGGALRQYEIMLILPAEADESVVSAGLERITRIVSEGGGEVGKVDRWGRRRLAFEIDKQNEGYYVVVEFTAEPTILTELDRTLHLADEILRFKVVVRGEAA